MPARRLILVLAVLLAGCGSSDPGLETAKRRTVTERATPAATATATPRTAAAAADVPAAVRAQAARLTRRQRIAQLFLVGFEGTDASVFPALRERGWGGLLMTADNVLSPDQGAVLAGETAVEWAVPPFVVMSGVAGFELPAQSPDDRATDVRAETATRAASWRAAGVSLALAPNADVAVTPDEPSFGDDPDRVARLAAAAVRGWREGGVIPAPGHFPGQGAASQDPLEGPASVGLSKEELAARDLVPFRELLRSPAMVVSSAAFSAYDPVTPASLTPAIATGLLRDELGYQGVAISDDLAGAAAATTGSVADAAVEALRAGIDVVQISEPEDAQAAYDAVLRAEIPAERLEEALLRVLALKRSAL